MSNKVLFDDNIHDLRKLYYTSWQAYRLNKPLSALEKHVAAVIIDHPEYQPLFEHEGGLYQQFEIDNDENNPFLHMGLHLALREQIMTDRPAGIRTIFTTLSLKQPTLTVEHGMMACLKKCLHAAQREKQEPDEAAYINALQHLL